MSLDLSRRAVLTSAVGLAVAPSALALPPVDIVVESRQHARVRSQRFRCAVGRSGIVRDKREGDGGTPAGVWPLREVFYRPDRLAMPVTRLPVRALAPTDGWCDAPGDARYNKPVRLPYPASAEQLWRADHMYDLIVVVGYNDAPVAPGKGSAIFLHVARTGYTGTAGCVAFASRDLLSILARVDRQSRLVVIPCHDWCGTRF
jgi:L,D-peptidoglycan transpeptidase YkuD (ErfK/YbiS/YcfS/YnhG family)